MIWIKNRVCPICESKEVLRSQRNSRYERMISLLGIYPYRCYDCNARGLGFRFRNPPRPPQQ
jgi:hypothetical protein